MNMNNFVVGFLFGMVFGFVIAAFTFAVKIDTINYDGPDPVVIQ